MKIGIITWYSGQNYGTNLQAIALQWFLRNHGYEVKIIDYDDKFIEYNPHRSIHEKIMNQPNKYALKYAYYKYKADISQRDISLYNTIREKCDFTSKVGSENEFVEICNSFDLLIVGSDQVWNPTWYSPIYYFDYEGIHTNRISYAPSLGVNTIPIDVVEKIKHGLNRFSAVSVREETGVRLLNNISPVSPKLVVDPTLLLNENDWETIFPIDSCNRIKDKYVLCIFLSDNISHWHASKKYAKKNKLKMVVVPYMGISYFIDAQICAGTDLSLLLDLIRNAECIITDSFHISVFSIIHKKNFYVFERFKENKNSSTNSRVRNLLSMTKLENRMISYNSNRINKLESIDYRISNCHLEKIIEESKSFLFDSINLI